MAKRTRKTRADSSAPADPGGISDRWRKILRLIPGYDCIATALPGDWFDEAEADKHVSFFAECLHHIEGAVAGKPFILEPWEQAIIGALFGWKRFDASKRTVRRYRELFLLVPRKNGKTPLTAGIGLDVLFCDEEPGAQCYCAAAERDQASLIYRHARGMVEREPELEQRAQIFKGTGHRSIVLRSDPASSLKVLSAEADSKHGGNSHLIVIDELHAQKNRELVDVLVTSTASEGRKQPLIIYITTADFERESICNELHDRARRIRDGLEPDSRFLPVLYEATANDEWTDPEVWARVNPNLSISVSREYLERECEKAKRNPAYENTFKRLHLNIRTEQDVRWLPVQAWDECKGIIDWNEYRSAPCYAGLDLSSSQDMTSLVLVFPEFEPWVIRAYHWCPRETALTYQRERGETPYMTWGTQGHIELVDGEVIDYELIRRRVGEIASLHRIEEVAIDPWQSPQMITWLEQDGLVAFQHRQGFASMAGPCKQLTERILNKGIRHDGNPVMRWMMSSVSTESDAAGNIKFSKKNSYGKIDGMVALAMATGRASVHAGEHGSVYDRGDLLIL